MLTRWGNLSRAKYKKARAEAKAERKIYSQHPKLLGIGPATGFAKLSPETLLWAHEAGHLSPHRRTHGSRLLPAFDPDELHRFAEEWRTRIDPKALSEELNIPFHGIEQFVTLGMIEADAPALPGTGPHFHPETVDAFLDAVEAASVSIGVTKEDRFSLPLTKVMRKISGRAKPWGPVLQYMLDGTLPFAIRADEKLADSILISPDRETTILTAHFDRTKFDFPFSERINLMEALDLLNLSHQKRAMLDGLSYVGKNPRAYLVSEVEQLAREMASQ